MNNLDNETKARIEAEEAYRAQLRNQKNPVPPTPTPPVKKNGGCGKWLLYGLGGFLLLGVIGAMMGGSETTTATTPATQTAPATQAESSETPPTETTEQAATPASSNGDATVEADGSYSVGVWNISDVAWSTADNLGGEFGENVGEGETFVVVNFTLKNTTNETQSYSSLIDTPQIILSDGGLIDADTILSGYASDQLVDGQIAPGLQRSGTYAFRVPTASINGMQFQIQFVNGKRLVVPLQE